MCELAHATGDQPVLMSTIAERQQLSRKYLHALLTALKTAGLVRSTRGSGGGFTLARAPEDIRLSEILRALEGPLTLVDCVGDEMACDRSGRCAARLIWQAVAAAVEGVLDKFTLADMVAMKQEANTSDKIPECPLPHAATGSA